MINVNDYIKIPNQTSFTLIDGNYPNGLLVKMYYDNPPSNTVYSSNASNQWYQSKLLQDCMIQLALNQQRIYEQDNDTKNYSDTALLNISQLKTDTSQIISLLGGTPQSSTFNNYSAKLAVIDKKLDNLGGGDSMTPDGSAIFGLLLALIVAVTWRG